MGAVTRAGVLAGLRTPIGRYGGALSGVRPDDLAALVIRAVVDRSGIPEDRAKEYERGINEGGILVGVNARDDADAEYFENDWRTNRGEHVYR